MNNPTKPEHVSKKRTSFGIVILRILVTAVVGASFLVGALYVFTPTAIRNPTNAHYHFRMNLEVNGKLVNFAENKYQTDALSDSCSAALTKQPIHFHDRVNQFVHVHWANMTGGEVLKNYGWNMIGGLPDTLGWRFDKGNILSPVSVHGNDLPSRPINTSYYVYVGNSSSYSEKTWKSFLDQPLTVFFNNSSTAQSHSNTDKHSVDDQKLVRLNNVIGSTVIFVQRERPTEAQIKDRFDHLEPLPETQCSG